MSSLQEIRQGRLEKINKLKEIGINPYVNPETVKQDLTLKEVNEQFAKLKESGEGKKYCW